MKYRAKEFEIEAMEFDGTVKSLSKIGEFTEGEVEIEIELLDQDSPLTIVIERSEGNIVVKKGDYIVKGVHGEFYSCEPDIFHGTYEKIEKE